MTIFRVVIEWYDGTKTNLKPDSVVRGDFGRSLKLEDVADYVFDPGNIVLEFESTYDWEQGGEEDWQKQKEEDYPGFTRLRLSKIAAVHVIYEKE